MCTRYVSPDQADIERAWHIGRDNQPKWAREVFPRSQGPFLRLDTEGSLVLVAGTWGLIPSWSQSAVLKFSTSNCRAEEAADKPTFRDAWRRSQRCIIPALSFDEPCWESGRNVWWRFTRTDGLPWGLAGLWNTWVDWKTGEVVESYTMLTVNADGHPWMSRMHKPDPKLPADKQDKRSVVAIEAVDAVAWLRSGANEQARWLHPPASELIECGPVAAERSFLLEAPR